MLKRFLNIRRVYFAIFLCILGLGTGLIALGNVKPEKPDTDENYVDLDRASKLSVGVCQQPPFSFFDEKSQAWHGISVDILRLAAEKLDLNLSFVATSPENYKEQLADGSIDIIAGPLNLDHQLGTIDASIPYLYSTLAVGSRDVKVPYYRVLANFLFSEKFLYPFITLFVLLLISGYIIERLEGHNKKNLDITIKDYELSGFIWSLLMFSSIGASTPQTKSARIYTIFWVFFSIFGSAAIIGSIVSSFSESEKVPQISNLHDLRSLSIAAKKESDASVFLTSNHLSFQSFDSVADALNAVSFGEAKAVVADEILLRYAIKTRPSEVSIAPAALTKNAYAFALPLGSHLRTPINQALSEVLKTRAWKNIVFQYLGYVPYVHDPQT